MMGSELVNILASEGCVTLRSLRGVFYVCTFLPYVPSGGRYCLGSAMTCQELKAYLRTPVFLKVFSRLVPSLNEKKKARLLTSTTTKERRMACSEDMI